MNKPFLSRNAALLPVLLVSLAILSLLDFAHSAAAKGDSGRKSPPLENESVSQQRFRGATAEARLAPRRAAAIIEMERQEAVLRESAKRLNVPAAASWVELGPAPLPNGETQQAGVTAAVTGRATAVVVDPTNSNKVYLGTAQGGVWRSLDGGATWTSIFDSAQSLAIGALALAPSSPGTLYVGTGETGGRLIGSTDYFFGVGLYRIDNADTTATLVGPINPAYSTGLGTPTTTFTGRGIRKIIVHPTDPATIFVCSSTTGFAGIIGVTLGNQIPPLGLRGLYRSTNATAAANAVTFQKLPVVDDNSFDNPATGNTAVWDAVLEPGNSNHLLATVAGTDHPGGVFRTTNALDPAPTFTQTLTTYSPDGLAMRLAINKVGSVVTVYVTSNEDSDNVACSGAAEQGRVRKSVDAGVTWGAPLPAAEGFCGGLCIYDNPIAIDPNDANIVYLGGSARGTCSDVLKKSADGGTTFTRDDTGLHAHAHGIFIDALSTPAIVWLTNDGGLWKRPDAAPGTAWINENKAPLGTIQFQSIAVHPTDRNFTIGGTQDNGTVAQQTTSGNWIGAEGDDGGFALIDQTATDTTNVTMYHTFGNLRNSSIGFARANLGSCLATKDSWEFRGAGGVADPTPSCDGSARRAANGINVADNVNYFPPLALGPGGAGNPNVVYFGSDRLYRSTNKGDTMSVVSQAPLVATGCGGLPCPITAIGISPANDNVRVIAVTGRDGEPSPSNRVFATITGSSTLTDISPTLPDNPNRDFSGASQKYISRAVIDPNNPNVAYLALSYFTPAGQGIYKTSNLNDTGTNPVNWTPAGNGIPSIPIDSFVVDPGNSNRLFAGTDIGVYVSVDAGANWSPYGSGLPRVAVFDMAIQPTNHILRIATHGRGMWEIPAAPTATATISGKVLYANGVTPGKNVTMTLTGTGGFGTQMTTTDSNGNYSFLNLPIGNDYTLTPSKTGDINGIESLDSSNVARYVAGLDVPTTNQRIAADADGDNILSSLDASLIARRVAGLPGSGIVGTWKFAPVNRTYTALAADQPGQNFSAILVGDTSGNWLPAIPSGGGGDANLPAASVLTSGNSSTGTPTVMVLLPNVPGPAGATISVPIAVGDLTGQGVKAYDLQVTFDPTRVQPPATPYDTAGTLSGGMLITPNATNAGHLIISAFQATDLSGSGTLINLKFVIVGTPGQSTALTFANYTDPGAIFHPGFHFNASTPAAATTNGSVTINGPTATNGAISGRITSGDGTPVAGAVVTLSGGQARKTITDANGNYQFDNIDTGGFYTVTPSRANFDFNPVSRSFSQQGNKTEAAFTGTSTGDIANPLDTAEYFVRQEYVDILGREPDEGGLNFWSDKINQCLSAPVPSEPPAVAGGSANVADCLNTQRINVAAAFFIAAEFQQSGSFLYDVYVAALGRKPAYAEYALDRQQVVGGATLDAEKMAFARSFVLRAEFKAKYQNAMTAETFIDELLQSVQASGADLRGERDNLISSYNSRTGQTQSRAAVVRSIADNAAFKQSQYNAAFVLTEYFGYLRRDPERGGYDFWLNVVNNVGDYRGMVCSFITSAEYQNRFSQIVSRSNGDCGQ